MKDDLKNIVMRLVQSYHNYVVNPSESSLIQYVESELENVSLEDKIKALKLTKEIHTFLKKQNDKTSNNYPQRFENGNWENSNAGCTR